MDKNDILNHFLEEKKILYWIWERFENFHWVWERLEKIDDKIDFYISNLKLK